MYHIKIVFIYKFYLIIHHLTDMIRSQVSFLNSEQTSLVVHGHRTDINNSI